MEEVSENAILATMVEHDLVVKMPPTSEYIIRAGAETIEYGGLSCWIEGNDDPPTAQQLVEGLARSAIMWGGTPSGHKGSLRFYAGQMRKYRKLLLERLGVDSGE